MNKVIQAKFEQVPKTKDNTPQKKFDEVFGNMIGKKYNVYLSEFTGEYVIFSGVDEESEKEYQNSIYKSLIESGEEEEYAKGVAYGDLEPEGCIYFEKECFAFKEV